MNEFVSFGKLVMTKNLKHYQTIIADIIERNLIFDFSDLKTRGEEGLHPNRTLKTMLLSLDKVERYFNFKRILQIVDIFWEGECCGGR